MKKLLSLLLVACCMGASACSLPFGGTDTQSVSVTEEEKSAGIEYATETMVAIRVVKVDGEPTLLTIMEELSADGALTFKESGGMVTSINGKDNPADWSACWMLYTSDAEMSNMGWGVIEYEGNTYGSAILGAGSLSVSVGEYYIWSYQSF
jgi:hypothetical protein